MHRVTPSWSACSFWEYPPWPARALVVRGGVAGHPRGLEVDAAAAGPATVRPVSPSAPVTIPALSVLGVLLPFLTRPSGAVCSQYRGLVTHLQESSRECWPGFRDGWTIRLVSRHLLEGNAGLPNLKVPIDERWYPVLQVLSGLSVLVWSQWLRRRGVGMRSLLTRTLAAGSSWLLILGPAAEHPTYVFLAPFLAWGLVRRSDSGGGALLIVAAGLFLLVLGWGSLTRRVVALRPLADAATAARGAALPRLAGDGREQSA